MQAGARSSVKIFERTPDPALRVLIKRFIVVQFPPIHRDYHLPDAGAVAAFTFQGSCRLNGEQWAPPAAFTGPRHTLRSHEHCVSHSVVLAIFTPVGANAFLRAPLEEFAGVTSDLTDVFGQPDEFDRLREKLAKAANNQKRTELVETFLVTRIRVSQPDPLIAAAVDWLEQTTVAGRIDELTRFIGLSQSALERRFRRIVGMSPKKFASLVRLRRAVQLQAAGADLTTAAHTAGYFDQSHFIKDFRRATGRTPSEFFRQSSID